MTEDSARGLTDADLMAIAMSMTVTVSMMGALLALDDDQALAAHTVLVAAAPLTDVLTKQDFIDLVRKIGTILPEEEWPRLLNEARERRSSRRSDEMRSAVASGRATVVEPAPTPEQYAEMMEDETIQAMMKDRATRRGECTVCGREVVVIEPVNADPVCFSCSNDSARGVTDAASVQEAAEALGMSIELVERLLDEMGIETIDDISKIRGE